MPRVLQNARELFLHAVGKLPPEQWEGYVAEACGGDADLEQQVSHLLKVHREAGSFLNRPAEAIGATGAFTPESGTELADDHLERAGTVIGPYTLLQQIGEGGMGTVFMAEQTQPVQRKVALKVIKAGMDSKQVIARFEAEQQALALMDHPNIAKVLDAGTTEGGRPYFVMELVKGVPITRYCDEHHLTPRQRLELFMPVCQAVQHAHQKGIIHRDLKPSNVMVCLYDGKPVPKVIDFGVAKAAGARLSEKTLFTEFGQIVGTLEYMSPEQAELNQLDIDTRSDIYSLGVLLYELLTGTTPLERKRFQAVAFLEVLRLIREEESQRPSTRLSTAEGLPSIAANRGLEPKKLSGLMRGELDWIVMKTLEKDRNRRYETANGLAMDVQRYLTDEPVQACPPSVRYRFRKFARRNKRTLATAALLVVVLVATVATLAVSNVIISHEKDAKSIALTEKGEALILAQANKEAADDQRRRAEDNLEFTVTVLDQILLKPAEKRLSISHQERHRLVAQNPERRQLELDLLQKGAEFYAQFAHRNGNDSIAQLKAARAYQWLAAFQHAMEQHAQSVETYRGGLQFLEIGTSARRAEPDYLMTQADLYFWITYPLSATKQFAQAEEAARRGLACYEKLTIVPAYRTHGDWGVVCSNIRLGSLLLQVGRSLEAEQAFRELLTASDKVLGTNPGNNAIRFERVSAGDQLGDLYAKTEQFDKAIETWEQVVKDWAKLAQDTDNSNVGADRRWHWAVRLHGLGVLLEKANRNTDAEQRYLEAFPIWQKLVKDFNLPDHRYHLAMNRYVVGSLYRKTGRSEAAVDALEEALVLWQALVVDHQMADHRNHLFYTWQTLLDILMASAIRADGNVTLSTEARKAMTQRLARRALALQRKVVPFMEKEPSRLNTTAWHLATCADPRFRDLPLAVELATKATTLSPIGAHWTTLGVARYGVEDWKGAVKALAKSAQLSNGGDSLPRFFLAMAHWKLDQKQEARKWYDQAVAWMEKNRPQDEELKRLRAVAENVLNIKKKPTPK